MQYRTVGGFEISRLGLGTKRLPQTDVTHVVRVDKAALRDFVQKGQEAGINYIDTSYSAGKGEVEAELGESFSHNDPRLYVSTSYYDMIDPRFDYVLQKQMKKLETDCIDFYHVEGFNDIVKDSVIDSGSVDYFFEQKEAGHIANLGFTSDLSAENLTQMLKSYPWDFVRLRINFFEWYTKSAREQYEVAAQAGIPIFVHGALRVGPAPLLKPDTLAFLNEAAPDRTRAQWCLGFVKALEGVSAVAVNVKGVKELQEDTAVFEDDAVLAPEELALLEEASRLQGIVTRVS